MKLENHDIEILAYYVNHKNMVINFLIFITIFIFILIWITVMIYMIFGKICIIGLGIGLGVSGMVIIIYSVFGFCLRLKLSVMLGLCLLAVDRILFILLSCRGFGCKRNYYINFIIFCNLLNLLTSFERLTSRKRNFISVINRLRSDNSLKRLMKN